MVFLLRVLCSLALVVHFGTAIGGPTLLDQRMVNDAVEGLSKCNAMYNIKIPHQPLD
jgi:hypothetical protein